VPVPVRLRPWMLVSAAWIVPAVLGTVNELAQRRLAGRPRPELGELIFAGGDWLLYACLTPAVFSASRRWPLSRPRLARNASVQLLMSLLFCAAWAGAGTVLRVAVAPQTLYYDPVRYFISWLFITFPFGVAVYLSVVGIEHAIRYFAEARYRELQIARLSEQLTGARFEALQAQVNPHFLFNTLNTIAVLVRDDDRDGAVRIVEHLAAVLRRTLARDRSNEVTLAGELELVQDYLAIEQARFSDRLRPVFVIDEALRAAAVPSFALQHLVENAIRHGIARQPDAGLIQVSARRDGNVLELTVLDDGPGIEPSAVRPGHGLANTRERLRALYGERASLGVARVSPRGTAAILRVPYHELRLERDDAR